MPDEMIGVCDVCGIHQWKEPHVHRTYGTLSPEDALDHWMKRAAESGQ